MLSHEYYLLRDYNRLQTALNAYYDVFNAYQRLLSSHLVTSETGNVPPILFHHLELASREMQEAYQILHDATTEAYNKAADIKISESATVDDSSLIATFGEYERTRSRKNLQKLKQFVDANEEQLKLLSEMKRSEQIVIEHKTV